MIFLGLYLLTFIVQTLIFIIFSRILARVEKLDLEVASKKRFYRIYFLLLNYN